MTEKIIYVSETNGFCKGVKNAVDTALRYAGENVYTFGEIVHNKRVVNKLASLGIRMTEDVSGLKKGDTLIIRSHGAKKSVFGQCEKSGVKVVDATCPYVKVIRNKAAEYFGKGYLIVLVGDKNHPELQGINGWCGDSAVFFDGKGKLRLETDKNVLVLFQTTYESKKVDETLQNIVADNAKTVEFFNTICYTTEDRQNYALCVSRKSECCVVVGGRNSSNTKKLFDIAKSNCKDTFLVEEAVELSDICLSKYSRMSLIAGASTPQELMEEVLSKMFAEAKDNSATVAVEEISKENEAHEFASAVEKIGKRRPLKKGQKIKGTVSHISEEGVNVSVGSKTDGFIPNEEVSMDGDFEAAKKNLKVGDSIEVIITSTDKGLTLSRKEVEELYKDDELVEGIKEGKEFDLVMNKAVKGGLLSKLGSYTVFVPASHIRNGFVRDLTQYVGKKLRLIALEDGIDDNKKKIVASQRALLEREKKEREDNFWNNIEVGEIVDGKVLRFASFGAFVSVRGMDCLAHLSDLSWNPVKEPGDVLELNKTYEFVVLKLDRETNRVSIGYKQLQPHPWQIAAEKYTPGTVVKGKVARILPFGAFVELGDGIDGLLHISNISWDWLSDITQVIKIGDEVEAMVMDFDLENRRITLSRKALIPEPGKAAEAEKVAATSEEPTTEEPTVEQTESSAEENKE